VRHLWLAFFLHAPQTLGRNLGADCRAHGQVEGQQRQGVEIDDALRFSEIAIENDVGWRRKSPFAGIHQQEGKIVEQIAGCDQRTELNGIKEHRPPTEEHDVAQMQVAMDAANKPALGQEPAVLRIRDAACPGERFNLCVCKQLWRCRKRIRMLIDVGMQRGNPGRRLYGFRFGVRRNDRTTERVRQLVVDLARACEVIEGCMLIKAVHLDGPFHDGA
jgi:hypothetical protein